MAPPPDNTAGSSTLHVATPLVESAPLSAAAGGVVLLKLESAQPVGSFKIRGIGAACQQSVAAGARRLVSSSGGNAGYAVAYAARHLGVPVEVFVPVTTPQRMRAVIRGEGATVTEHGASWDDAHAAAVAAATDPAVAYIHPFDDPRIWRGHATLVEEVAAAGAAPDLVVVAVGGGGLLLGVVEGLRRVGWEQVPVLAVETRGAASFAAAVAAGELVTLPAITSVATSLGARTVAAEALAATRRHPITSLVVEDVAAVAACARFADDHRVLVEPACGAALAAVYDRAEAVRRAGCVVVVVCGGAAATCAQLRQWQRAVAD